MHTIATLAVFSATTPAATAADLCPNAGMRSLQGATALPDCRAYELVSPGWQKMGGSINHFFSYVHQDGDAVVYPAQSGFGGTNNLGHLGSSIYYRAQRQAGGWRSTFLTNLPLPNPTVNSEVDLRFYGASRDLSRIVQSVSYAPIHTAFTDSLWQIDPDGAPTRVAAKPAEATAPLRAGGISANGRSTVFTGPGDGTPLAPIPGYTPCGFDCQLLYEYIDGGQRLVNVDDDGQLLTHLGAAPAGAFLQGGVRIGDFSTVSNAISADGSRIFFYSHRPGAAPSDPVALYVRVGGQRTFEVSASEIQGGGAPTSDVIFAGASSDGTAAYFTSTDRLTGDAPDGATGPFLYAFELPAGAASGELRLVEGEHPVDTASTGAGGVLPIAQVRVSDDGSRVYYLSTDAGGSLYRYDVASRQSDLLAADVGQGLLTVSGAQGAEATPTGGHLLFLSSTGFLDGAGGQQAYLYEDATGTMRRVSSGPAEPSLGYDVQFVESTFSNGNYDQNFVSDDGRFAFFETAAPLVAQDSDGTADVYRWSAGGVALVTRGISSDSGRAYLTGASADGGSVFFKTYENLLAQDGDADMDLYAARIGGGIPDAADPAPRCVGDDCQPGTSGPTPPPLAGTLAFGGVGNLTPAGRGARAARFSLRKSVRGAVATLRLRVPGTGVVTARGRSVKRARRSVGKAGAYAVRISLTRKAARAMRSGRTISTEVRVTFARRAGARFSRTVQLTFKKPSSDARKDRS